jgi:hypothetical protein
MEALLCTADDGGGLGHLSGRRCRANPLGERQYPPLRLVWREGKAIEACLDNFRY